MCRKIYKIENMKGAMDSLRECVVDVLCDSRRVVQILWFISSHGDIVVVSIKEDAC